MIRDQNRDLRVSKQRYNYQRPESNFKLASILGIKMFDDSITQDYSVNDIRVAVI